MKERNNTALYTENISSALDVSDIAEDLDISHVYDEFQSKEDLPKEGWTKKSRILKQRFIFANRAEDAAIWMEGRIPAPGEDLVTITTGMWDYWHLPLYILNKTPIGAIREIYVSTWAFNRETLISLQEQIERHKCKVVFMVTTFNSDRYPAEHYLLVQTIEKYGGKLITLNQHSKIFLVDASPNFYSFTGSANMTKNENIEQTTVTNDKDRFLFYRQFFQHFLPKHERRDYTD